ncbi:MAG: TRAP transporter small permease [Velocimicrobium sp.]
MMLQKIRKIIDNILYAAIIILFLTMFGVITLNVILRYFFNSPLSFAVELGRYTFAGIIYLGSIFVMKEDGHIGLDIIVDAMPQKAGKIIKKFTRILVLCYMCIFCYESFRMVLGNWANRSSTMRIPMSVVYLVMVFGSAGIFIEELLFLLGINKKEELPDTAGGGM